MEDVAWRTFLGFVACFVVGAIVTGVVFMWIWLGWWLLIGMVGLFMALCIFYCVGLLIDHDDKAGSQ